MFVSVLLIDVIVTLYLIPFYYCRTGLMETPRSKPSPPPPRLTKSSVTKSDGSSPSSVHSTRLSLDRSPQSVNSKPSPDRRTARVPTPPEASQNKLHPFDIIKTSVIETDHNFF